MNTERGSKLKRMGKLEVAALHSLTLLGTQAHTDCLGQSTAQPLTHRQRAAKPRRPAGHHPQHRALWHTEDERCVRLNRPLKHGQDNAICITSQSPTSQVNDSKTNLANQVSWSVSNSACELNNHGVIWSFLPYSTFNMLCKGNMYFRRKTRE